MGHDARLQLKTAEGVVFSYPLASPLSRLLAAVVDLAVVSVLGMVLWQACLALSIVVPDMAVAMGSLATFAAAIFYPMVLEYRWRGQTLGKRLLKVRVIDKGGLHLSASQIVVRNLLRPVDQLPAFYLVGGIVCLFSRHFQRLGDIAAATVVVSERPVATPRLDGLLAGKYNSLRDDPLAVARLRQHVAMAEIDLAMQALLRRDALNPEARVELFAAFADHFRKRARLPASETPVPDEQFVRNVVDIASFTAVKK